MQTQTMRDDALSIIISGSSAAIGIPAYLAWLRQEIDLSLRVLLTHSAERFLQPQVVAWHVDEVFTSNDASLNPTEFAKRSLGIVVLPATANMLASTALGLAATPAQTVLLASDRPAHFFPSMNATMWAKSSTQRHVTALRAEGHTVTEPQERPGFELWQRDNAVGPALPPPDEAAEMIAAWLENVLSAAMTPAPDAASELVTSPTGNLGV
jgi:phosphopantothenoylcysteine synthetase/decarboxylase